MRLPPFFVIDDAGTGAGDFAFTLLHVKSFHILDGVTRLGNAHGFAHHLVEIDEFPFPQQLINLRFTNAMQRHQAL